MDDFPDGSCTREPSSEEDDGDSSRRLSIDCLVNAGNWQGLGDFEPLLGRLADAIVRHADLPSARCSAALALSNDANVRRLNDQFRGFDKPTNVLSFPAHQPALTPSDIVFLGDVVLAEETVLREASDQAIPPRNHFVHLVAHGILHLLGFDHDRDDAAERMERIEAEILAELDIANPYHENQQKEALDRSHQF